MYVGISASRANNSFLNDFRAKNSFLNDLPIIGTISFERSSNGVKYYLMEPFFLFMHQNTYRLDGQFYEMVDNTKFDMNLKFVWSIILWIKRGLTSLNF